MRAGIAATAAIATATVFSLAGGAAGAPHGATTSARRIVIQGPTESTHVRMWVEGDAIVVKGHGIQGRAGCLPSGKQLRCSYAGASSIEVDTGPNPDKVQVLDPLPIPLTVHLGGGSDKLLGNDEQDTCYPEGAKRNRCYGFGGNDVCITGDKNSDCIGGSGDDYCKHGHGSDGCWGGPGNDVCYMGSGKDGCHGEAGNDRLYGGAGTDQLYGGSGRDYCDGGPGVGYSHDCEEGPGH